jgi:hypothetical protein
VGNEADEESRNSWNENEKRRSLVRGDRQKQSQAQVAGVALTPGRTLPDQVRTGSANEVSAGDRCCQILVDTLV